VGVGHKRWKLEINSESRSERLKVKNKSGKLAVETGERLRVGRKKPKVDRKTRKVDSEIEKVGNKILALPKKVAEWDEISLFLTCSMVQTPKNRLRYIPFQPFRQISPSPLPIKSP
jgi:hypothetical protein